MIYSTVITNGVLKSNMAISQDAPELAIPLAASVGYNALVLTIKSATDYNLPELKKLMKENGVYAHALATGQIYSKDHLSMGSGDEENRQACVARLCELVDLGQELDGAKLVIGTVRGCTSDAATPELYHQQFEKSLGEVCDYAKERNIDVILELIDYTESDCCNKLPELLDYLERLNRENLYMYLDTMHMYQEKEDICGILRDYANTVPQIDISGEDRLSPMDSVIDFEEVMQTIKATGYNGVLNMEFDVSRGENLSEKALNYVKRFFE